MRKRKETRKAENLVLVDRGDHESIVKTSGSYTTFEESLECRRRRPNRLTVASLEISRED